MPAPALREIVPAVEIVVVAEVAVPEAVGVDAVVDADLAAVVAGVVTAAVGTNTHKRKSIMAVAKVTALFIFKVRGIDRNSAQCIFS